MDILENAKDIYNLIKKLNQQDLLEKMADLRDQILELREENQKLKEKLLEKNKNNLIFENGAYFEIKEDGSKEGPFCSVCWERERKLIHLKEYGLGGYAVGDQFVDFGSEYRCPICKAPGNTKG